MAQLFSNNATTILANAVSKTANSIVVRTGDGVLFPNPQSPDFFLVTIQYNTQYEILRVDRRSGDTLYVQRAQENTIPHDFPAEATVELRLTAGTINRLISGVLHYQGQWSVVNGTLPTNPFIGDMYEILDTNTITGIKYQDGDFIFWSGLGWIKFRNSAIVNSVQGKVGDVVIQKGDINLGNVIDSLQLTVANNLSDVNNIADSQRNLEVDPEGTALRYAVSFQ